MTKDVRKEQVVLLRFEKKIAGLAAALAASLAAAKAADGKLHAEGATDAYMEIEAALLHLADVTSTAHASLEAHAQTIGAQILNAGGGIPKGDISGVVRSALGLG